MQKNTSFDTRIIEKKYQELFSDSPLMVRSPGRINLLGEHTDYNEGFVLPGAIDRAIYVGVGPRQDEEVRLYSVSFNENFEAELAALAPTQKGWPNYVLGVAALLRERGCALRGFNLVLAGDVPVGAGLSSSAAVECAVGFALNELFDLGLSRLELALIAQQAEHRFAGVRVGLMDMFASLFGKKNRVIRLDCRSLEYEYVPLELGAYQLVLLNSQVHHSLASSEYNTRRQQCERGVELVRAHQPQVHSLRDVTLEMLERWVAPQDRVVYRRCRYVVEENERLLAGCADLQRGALAALGKKMFQTHEGLSRDYEVSCPELDFLVDAVRNQPGVLGARMMGGGFGGCTLNLVEEEQVEKLIAQVGEKYKEDMNKELTAYVVRVEDGTSVVSRPAI